MDVQISSRKNQAILGWVPKIAWGSLVYLFSLVNGNPSLLLNWIFYSGTVQID